MYDKNQIEDSLEFIRQMKDFYESNDFFTDFDPMEGHGDDELFANLAENLEQKNRLMESVTQGVQTTGAFPASAEEEKRRQLEEQRIAEERRAAQEERRLLEEERKQLQREIRQRELQERQRALEAEQKRQAEIEAERRRIEKERQAALEEQMKQEEIRKQIEEERKRLAAEQKLAAERRAAEEKLAAERQAAEEERRRAERERQTALEEQRKIEEERRRLAAEQKWAAEHKAAEEKLAAERKAAEEKLAAERRVAEEERRRMEAERRANEEKLAAERRAAEEKLAAERKAAEEERRRIEAERQRLAEERLQREIEEQKRLVAEQRRREEEKLRREAEEKKRRQEMVLAEERRRKEIEEEERRKAAREQEERIAAEKQQREAELAKQNSQTGQVPTAEQSAVTNDSTAVEKKEGADTGTNAQAEAAITATPVINIAAPNASTTNTPAEKQPSTDTEVSRLQKRAEELQRQAEMATLEARMRQLQLEAQVAKGVYPTPQINIPAAGNTAANGTGNAAVPFAQISIPGMANNAESADNSNQKSSKESVDDIFLRELEKFQGGDENSSGRMKNEHPLQKYINNFDGKTLSSLIPAEKIIDVGYKVKDVVDDQIWNIKHFIQKKIDNSGDIEAQQKTKKIISNLVVVAICVFFAYLIAMMITHFVAHPTKVEGESMETTLTNGDTVVIQKMSYYLGHPERYDVVVFPVPNYNSKTYYIKRVIGLPGETVQIKDGKVYIDEKELSSDKYGKDDYINDPGDVAEPITLAKNEYFVLGDNRNMSTDSRSSYVGMVNERYIIGKAWERIWPLSKIGSIGK